MRDLVKKMGSPIARNFWLANTGLSVPRKGDWLALIVGFSWMLYVYADTLQWVYSVIPEQMQRANMIVIVTATIGILIAGQLIHLGYRLTNQDDTRNMYPLLIGMIVALPPGWIVLSYMTQYH